MNIGSPGFVPQRLTEARKARGFTKVILAELLDVSQPLLTQYEKGTKTPKASTLKRLSTCLNMPESFFFYPVVGREDNATFYRSFKRATQSDRERGKMKFKWFGEIAQFLSEHVDFPNLDIPNPVGEKINPLSLEDHEIEEIASDVRKRWGLSPGPIEDLATLLECRGVLVTRARVSNDLDAFSRWQFENNRPGIFLVSDKDNYYRGRMDLGHELGHLVLHRHLDEEFIKKHLSKLEQQANRFAASFLVPKAEFLEDVFASTLDFFNLIKPTWGVSIAMMIYRCSTLGLVDEGENTRLWRSYNRRGFRKREIEDTKPPETPTLIRQAFEHIIEDKKIPRETVLRKLPFPQTIIEELALLDKNYLSTRKAEVEHFKPSRKNNSTTKEGTVIAFKK